MADIRELQAVIEVCNHIRNTIGADFVGLALQNEQGPDVRWHFATGNINEKYKRITVRFGKGIAGKVISSGNEMMIAEFPHHILGKVTDYPITLAEKLVSMFAVPLFFNFVPKGVLLVGNRTKKIFSELEQEQVKAAAHSMEQILKEHLSL